MAHITEFEIHGLAGRPGIIARKLNPSVNVFWGENGCGKTSLLKILSSAFSNDAMLIQDVAFETASVTFWSAEFETEFRRTISRTKDDTGIDADYTDEPPILEEVGDGIWQEVERVPEPRWSTTPLDKPRSNRPIQSFKHSFLPISRISRSARSISAGIQHSGQPPTRRPGRIDDEYFARVFADQVNRKWQSYNASANSSIRLAQQKALAEILAVLFGGARVSTEPVEYSGDVEAAYGLVVDFLRAQNLRLKLGDADFRIRYQKQTDLRYVVGLIHEVTGEVDEILRPQQEFIDVISRFYSGGKRIELDERVLNSLSTLRVTANQSPIPLEALSSGEKQLLQILLETLAAGQSSILIDEPELSMHVEWQLRIVESMRRVNPECQIILATHSPDVMADLPDEYLFKL